MEVICFSTQHAASTAFGLNYKQLDNWIYIQPLFLWNFNEHNVEKQLQVFRNLILWPT